jgi:hypothetical protein
MKTLLKNTFILFFILIIGISNAQTIQHDFTFKKGDEFQRQIVIKSNCVMQRGTQKLNISSYSAVTKTYKVNDVVNRAASFNITINKIIDTINALGQKVIYNSDKKPDPNSDIQMALLQMIGKSSIVSVDEKGTILSVQKEVKTSDTLLSFSGIQGERLLTGSTLEFIAHFSPNAFLKKGYTWADATPDSETNFTINAVTNRTTTIVYTTNILGGEVNTRINGVLLVDNESGIILKRSTKSISTGYESVKGVVYSTTRRSATSEICYKK